MPPARPALLLSLFVASALGCSKPEPPVITPKSAKVTAVSLESVQLDVDVDAFNPNAKELSAQKVSGKVVLDGRFDLGTTTVNSGVTLPPGAHTDVKLPLTVAWKDANALVTLATSNRSVPFTVDGTVTIGGVLSVDLPFHLAGEVTHQELVQATKASLPAIPGLKLPM